MRRLNQVVRALNVKRAIRLTAVGALVTGARGNRAIRLLGVGDLTLAAWTVSLLEWYGVPWQYMLVAHRITAWFIIPGLLCTTMGLIILARRGPVDLAHEIAPANSANGRMSEVEPS